MFFFFKTKIIWLLFLFFYRLLLSGRCVQGLPPAEDERRDSVLTVLASPKSHTLATGSQKRHTLSDDDDGDGGNGASGIAAYEGTEHRRSYV